MPEMLNFIQNSPKSSHDDRSPELTHVIFFLGYWDYDLLLVRHFHSMEMAVMLLGISENKILRQFILLSWRL